MAPQSRFRPWEDADRDDVLPVPSTQGVKPTQAQSLRPQYQTRSVASSSYNHPHDSRSEARSDLTLASNLDIDASSSAGIWLVKNRTFAVARSPDREDHTTRKHSLQTIQAKPSLLHATTTGSSSSISGGNVFVRSSGPRIRNASVACLQCRAKRRKCVNRGQAPCEACFSNDLPCVIDRSLDRRRKVAHRRRGRQGEQEKHILIDLLEVLRQPDMVQVHAALEFIRAGVSHEQLDEYLRLCLGNQHAENLTTSSHHTDELATSADETPTLGVTPEQITAWSKLKKEKEKPASGPGMIHSNRSSPDLDKSAMMKAPSEQRRPPSLIHLDE